MKTNKTARAQVTAVVYPEGITGPQSTPYYVTASHIGDISAEHVGEAVFGAIKNCGRPFPIGPDTAIIVTFQKT